MLDKILIPTTFYRWGNWDPARLNLLSVVTEPVNCKPRILTHVFVIAKAVCFPRPHCLCSQSRHRALGILEVLSSVVLQLCTGVLYLWQVFNRNCKGTLSSNRKSFISAWSFFKNCHKFFTNLWSTIGCVKWFSMRWYVWRRQHSIVDKSSGQASFQLNSSLTAAY